MSKVKWYRLERTVPMPEWSDKGDYFSLKSPTMFRINESEKAHIPTGLAIELPEGYQIMIRPVPKLIKYGINIWNTIVEKFDDVYHTTGKHQIYVPMNIDAYHSYEFYPGDEIARAVIIQTPQFEFEDATEFMEVTEEKAEELKDKVLSVLDNGENDEQHCGAETANIEGVG